VYVLVVGLNHRTAPVEIREVLAFSRQELPTALLKIKGKPHIGGCTILSTCNRTEVYAAVTDVEAGLAAVRDFLAKKCNKPQHIIGDYLYTRTLYDAVRHLFRVSSGLDSMILGETQILGQVREAYQIALECGATNGVLNTLFKQSITVGKKVRTETLIDQNPVSISYTAVELAKQSFGELQGRQVLVVGAGKMSELTLKHLVASGVGKIVVANRSLPRAEQLATVCGGIAIPFTQIDNYLADTDILISCTAASEYVISYDMVQAVWRKRGDRPIFMIDIAVPRDIDPAVGKIEGVILYDIDDLQHVVEQNLAERQRAASQAEEIIEKEIVEFFQWLGSLFAVPTIMALKAKAETIKQTELEKAMGKLSSLNDREKKVVTSLASSIVNQLMHIPIVNLKKYASTHQGHLYAEILQNLFDLEISGQQARLMQNINDGR